MFQLLFKCLIKSICHFSPPLSNYTAVLSTWHYVFKFSTLGYLQLPPKAISINYCVCLSLFHVVGVFVASSCVIYINFSRRLGLSISSIDHLPARPTISLVLQLFRETPTAAQSVPDCRWWSQVFCVQLPNELSPCLVLIPIFTK